MKRFFAAREKKGAEGATVYKQGAGEARSTALGDDAKRGIRLRLGVEVGFEIVQDAGFARPEHLFEAASFHRL